ncbi:hypothetical protein CR513_07690, partial [Mucuna pruriens]
MIHLEVGATSTPFLLFSLKWNNILNGTKNVRRILITSIVYAIHILKGSKLRYQCVEKIAMDLVTITQHLRKYFHSHLIMYKPRQTIKAQTLTGFIIENILALSPSLIQTLTTLFILNSTINYIEGGTLSLPFA